MPSSLGEALLAASERYGDAVAFQIRRRLHNERITYSRAAAVARRAASWLASRGLVPGDRIAVCAPNMPEYALLYHAAWLAGLVVVPIDVRSRHEVVQRIVQASGARCAFRSAAVPDPFGEAVEGHLLEDLETLCDGCPPLRDPPPLAPETLAVIVYTSGTTGEPKGVMLTHANLLAEIRGLATGFPLRRGLVVLSVLPLSHIYELAVTFLHGYSSGIRVVYVPRVNAVTIARAMAEAHVEAMVVVPELLRLLLHGIERRVRQRRLWAWWIAMHRIAPAMPLALRRVLFAPVRSALGGRLDLFGVGGASLDVSVARAWERMGVHVFEGYGLTETAAAATINARRAQRLGSAGRALPGVSVRCDSDNEIWIAGPTVTKGYFGDEQRTSETLRDGWLRTGDVGRIDRDGFLHITGRAAFRIVLANGQKVYPEDVERELNAEDVRDSCVVGVHDDRGRERVHAALLIDDATRAAEVVRAANARLADHQQIRTWSVWEDDDFPRGPTLKPDRVAVLAAIERRVASAAPLVASRASGDPIVSVLARVSGRSTADVRDETALEPDLDLDSIARIELLSMLEEELGVALDELAVGPRTTVADLRRLVGAAEPDVVVRTGPRWQRAGWARAVGDVLIVAGARIQRHWMSLEVSHAERASRIPTPSLLVFNYQGPYAALPMLRLIPRRLRHRVAVAADAEAWRGGRSYQGALIALAVQAFPLVKTGGPSRDSLEEAARWIDDGYAVLLAPEGAPSMREEPGEFLRGVGMLAVETGVPIVPFRLVGYSDLYPRHDTPFPWLPEYHARVRLIVGDPVCVPRGASYSDATALAKRAIFALD